MNQKNDISGSFARFNVQHQHILRQFISMLKIEAKNPHSLYKPIILVQTANNLEIVINDSLKSVKRTGGN